MNERKWYIKCDSAEGDNYSIIDLTDNELATVKRFCDAEVISEDYGGSDYIYDELPFDTRDEAVEAIKKCYHNCGYLDNLIRERNKKKNIELFDLDVK